MATDYVRQSVLRMISLKPCHVTGEHEPDHHLRSDHVCSLQKARMLDDLLAMLDIEINEVDRQPHRECYWCGADPKHAEWAKE
jgi:hypothetical protein